MPELPDVEVFKNYLDATSLHQHIHKINIYDQQVFESSAEKFKEILEGHSFDHTRRIGKYLFVKIKSDGYLLMHFGMTGYLKYFKNESEKPDYIQLLVSYSNGFHLAYISKRKLGKLQIIEDLDKFCSENEIGPDALELDKKEFEELLSGKKGMVKTALMNQSILSGLGNVYVDEILFQSHIHPEQKLKNIDQEQRVKIYKKMNQVLRMAISQKADPDQLPDNYLLPHRKEGEKCPECGEMIKKIRINNRGTYICPECQQK